MKIIDSFSGEYEFLSNFYDHEIFYDGRWWARNENAYQAAKTDDEMIKSAIWMATAAKSKRIGKSIKLLRPNWNMIRIFVMRDLVHIKFDDPYLCDKLLATDNAILIEGNNWNDKYWGCTKCPITGEWIGYNVLGNIHMYERDLRRRQSLQRKQNGNS